MNSLISNYRASLSAVVKQTTLDESNWKSEDWKTVWNIDQNILNDAFNQHGLVQSIFSSIGEITARNCKSIKRVDEKKEEQRPGRENYFKVVSDFAAVRVHCDVEKIQEKIDRIKAIVLALGGGQIHIRRSFNGDSFGFINKDKKYTDITQYVYVFLEKVGYPIEFQIGHEFASHTFTIDSLLRDNKDCGKVDLWEDGFYDDVKKYILNKSNGENPGSKDEILFKAKKIHQGNVPEVLQEILSKL